MKIFIPVTIYLSLNVLQNFFVYYYLGRVEKLDEYAAGSLGMFMHLGLALTITYGLNQTLNTFVSQAFAYGNLKMCSVYLYRALVAISISYPFIMIIMIFSKPLLMMMG